MSRKIGIVGLEDMGIFEALVLGAKAGVDMEMLQAGIFGKDSPVGIKKMKTFRAQVL